VSYHIPDFDYRRLMWAAFTLIPLVGACDWLAGVSRPEELRVQIQSEDIDSVTLVTSAFFLAITDPGCIECEAIIQLVESDTSIVRLPYDQVYAFTSREQYFVESFPTIPVETALSMRVSIDGRDWFDDFRTLLPDGDEGEPETLRFVYQFAELRIPGT